MPSRRGWPPFVVPPDVIVLDIQMPGGTGYAVLKQMKSSSKTKLVPVIVLCGSIDGRDHVKLKELGADEFLSKPGPSAAFCDLIQAARTSGCDPNKSR